MATVKENLIAAKALIDTPEKWGKGPNGIDPPPCGKCVMNACNAAADRTAVEFELYGVLRDALLDGDWHNQSLPLAAFNDHPDTTHADIMALFDRAIAAQDKAP